MQHSSTGITSKITRTMNIKLVINQIIIINYLIHDYLIKTIKIRLILLEESS